MKIIKKAAMFGLDARIALSIFGSLSIISGAVLYSAIQKSKATALLTELQNLGKAWEAFYLDTGQNLPSANPLDNTHRNFYMSYTSHLTINSNNIKNWKGPYLTNKKLNTFIMLLNSKEWTVPRWIDNICTSGKKCVIYSRIFFPDEDKTSLAKQIDKIIDNSDGPLKGKLRWYFEHDPSPSTGINLKIAPFKNPND